MIDFVLSTLNRAKIAGGRRFLYLQLIGGLGLIFGILQKIFLYIAILDRLVYSVFDGF
ncbi:hypothetical protein [Clostridium lapidicellarium]|uniref:hypothetical protein n=1 Tax=Clostridium lapidicellarium TaxID=3240931 RepID=UPI003F7A8818